MIVIEECWSKVNEERSITGGHSRSGGNVRFKLKSLLSSDLVSCWTESGSLKSSWPLGFKLDICQRLLYGMGSS